MQGAEIEGKGSYMRYVTEPEYRKERCSWTLIRQRLTNKILVGRPC